MTGLIPAHAGKTRGEAIAFERTEAHPRSRGENVSQRAGRWYASGSSPLTRGKPAGTSSITRMEGLIPAHAGKTPRFWADCPCGRAHPRSRGENRSSGRRCRERAGSSPLTRGKLASPSSKAYGSRLIPAHAGKTMFFSFVEVRGAAHPRSRGENTSVASPLPPTVGSSPLTRGKLTFTDDSDLSRGLIPAHAGKTQMRFWAASRTAAHPRSRGENVRRPVLCNGRVGSSPLTRGKQDSLLCIPADERLIPAHAGKTSPDPLASGRGAAHPRSRGENWAPCERSGCASGSSPLTRGKRSAASVDFVGVGLIPAHAGKTVSGLGGLRRCGAHPRSRGENAASPSSARP